MTTLTLISDLDNIDRGDLELDLDALTSMTLILRTLTLDVRDLDDLEYDFDPY